MPGAEAFSIMNSIPSSVSHAIDADASAAQSLDVELLMREGNERMVRSGCKKRRKLHIRTSPQTRDR